MGAVVSCSVYTKGIENILGSQNSVGIRDVDYVFVVARLKSEIVGYCLALKLVYEYELINLYVYQTMRRKGIARQLIGTIDDYLISHHKHYAIKFSEDTSNINNGLALFQHVLGIKKYRKVFRYKLSSAEMDWCFYKRCSARNAEFYLKHISEISEKDISNFPDLSNSYDPKFKDLTYVLKHGNEIAGFIIANNNKIDTVFILYLNIKPEYRKKGGAYSCIQLFTDKIKELPMDRRLWLSFYFYADEPKLCIWYRYLFGDLFDKHIEQYIIYRNSNDEISIL